MSIATKIIQYNTNGATFSVQKQLVITTVSTGYVNIEAGGGGVTDHGALTGLADDDHPQYLNNSRGDLRYQPLASVLTNTTASFTTSLETKLNGIQAGAEVNVNADWNAVSGDAQILNKPTLFAQQTIVTSGDYTAANADNTNYFYLISGNHVSTLPTAVGNTSRYTFKNNHSAVVTINTTSSQTIDGSTPITLIPYQSVDIISTGSNWSVI